MAQTSLIRRSPMTQFKSKSEGRKRAAVMTAIEGWDVEGPTRAARASSSGGAPRAAKAARTWVVESVSVGSIHQSLSGGIAMVSRRTGATHKAPRWTALGTTGNITPMRPRHASRPTQSWSKAGGHEGDRQAAERDRTLKLGSMMDNYRK